MSARVFLDTNVLVYASLEDQRTRDKRLRAVTLLNSLESVEVFISVQVLNELYSVFLRNGLGDETIRKLLKNIMDSMSVADITGDTVKRCWKVRSTYHYSYYDSLIIASALESKCGVIYTEDLQDGQAIGKSTVIKNPFNTGAAG